jgi:hypothetical protein
MLTQDILEKSARAFLDKPAVWFNGVWKTYADVNRQAATIPLWTQKPFQKNH